MGRRSCNEPVPSAAPSSKWMRQYQDLLSRDRNAGAHRHSDAILLHPLNYGRKNQHQSSESAIRHYGLISLMVVDGFSPCRVLVSGTKFVSKARINLKFVSQSE
jgi:hypothetical protein